MTIPPEIIIAGVAALVSVLGAIAAIGKFVPALVKRHFDILQTTQSVEANNKQKQIDAQIEKQHADSLLLISMADSLKLLTNQLAASRQETADQTKAISANAAAITSVTESTSELNKHFNALLDTGSKPVQEIRAGVITLLERTANITALTEVETQVKADRATIEKAIADLMSVATDLRMAVVLVQDHIRTLQRVKTGELPKLSAIIANEGDVNPVS